MFPPILTALSLFLFFMNLTLLKSEVFCRISLHFGWSDIFSWLDCNYGFLWKRSIEMMCPSHNIRGHVIATWLITGDINLISWLSWCLPDFSIIKLLLFSPTLFIRSHSLILAHIHEERDSMFLFWIFAMKSSPPNSMFLGCFL